MLKLPSGGPPARPFESLAPTGLARRLRDVSATAFLFPCLFLFLGMSASVGQAEPDTPLAATGAGVIGSAAAGHASEQSFEDFDHANFGRSSEIDNPWMPLKPGMRFAYEGTTIDDEDGEELHHRVVIHVTDLTKMIDGVRSRVTWDLDYSDGELVEAELAFFAQDDDGRVWRMGEHPEEYEDGRLIDAPTWIAGISGAKAGISMPANPRPGTRSYSQGWAPAVGFTDRGQVDLVGQETKVPFGSYGDVVVIAETSASEPGAAQLKYFARGVGNIRVGWRGKGEKTKEVLELVEAHMMSPQERERVRDEALGLEESAYKISKEVYIHTSPVMVHGPVTAQAGTR